MISFPSEALLRTTLLVWVASLLIFTAYWSWAVLEHEGPIRSFLTRASDRTTTGTMLVGAKSLAIGKTHPVISLTNLPELISC